MNPIVAFASVGFGGAIGSMLRYAVTLLFVARIGPGFPWHTATINIVGSFLIGAIAAYTQSGTGLSPAASALLTVGILGGFTTFSTFSYDTVVLLNDGTTALAIAYCAGSVVSGVLAALAGMTLVRLALHAV